MDHVRECLSEEPGLNADRMYDVACEVEVERLRMVVCRALHAVKVLVSLVGCLPIAPWHRACITPCFA